jgi:hypothetical protein
MRRAAWPWMLALLLGVAGCASTPQASREQDLQAKQFGTHPGMATLYVYRPESGKQDSVLWVDNRLIGSTLPFTYYRVDLDPGRHVLTGIAGDNGRLTIETRPDQVVFVALTIDAGQSHFQPVPEAFGRKALTNCCYLLETWAPGQRPLLR